MQSLDNNRLTAKNRPEKRRKKDEINMKLVSIIFYLVFNQILATVKLKT